MSVEMVQLIVHIVRTKLELNVEAHLATLWKNLTHVVILCQQSLEPSRTIALNNLTFVFLVFKSKFQNE
jgi:hypothetical protein